MQTIIILQTHFQLFRGGFIMRSLFKASVLAIFFLGSIFSTSYAQLPWTKDANNPIITGGGSGTWNRLAMTPNVLYNSDSLRYEMWYSASAGYPAAKPYRIGFATSPDGISWTLHPNPVLEPDAGTWDEATVEWPMVLRENGEYKMWYTGWKPNFVGGMGIGYATSPDGINWTKYANNPVMGAGTAAWEEGGSAYSAVIPVSGGYKMWYTGVNLDSPIPSETNIGYASSSDGISWQKDTLDNPVLTIGAPGQWDNPKIMEPVVVFIDSVYHMWYTGGQIPSGNRRDIGWATSVDGIHWNKYNNSATTAPLYADSDPVLTPTSGQWDGMKISSGTVMLEGDSLRMWYTGWVTPAPPNTMGIGHATAPLNLHVPSNFATIQEAINAAKDGNVVLVDEGTYYENINFKGKAITVASHYYFDGDTSHISNTIINGSSPSDPDSGSVVYFISGEDSTSILCGFTITGGNGTYNTSFDMYFGGGIHMQAGGKVLFNKITGNHLVSQKAGYGAGMMVSSNKMSGNIVIEHNEFKYNSIVSPLQSGGGGIHIPLRWWTGGYCRVKNNSISYNSVTVTGTYKSLAGGIMLSFTLPTTGEVIIESNKISHNELHCVASVGAGIYVAYFDPGNAISDENPSPLICNNIVTNNYSEGMGGGIAIWTVEYGSHYPNSNIKPQPTIINNTIVDNEAQDGCGLFSFDSYPLLINNILWNDLSIQGSNEIFDSDINFSPYVPPYHDPINDGEVFIRYTNIQGSWEDEGNTNVKPSFVDTANGDFNLLENSPGIGWGIDTTIVPKSDFYGNIRPHDIDEFVDMGAIESQFKKTPPTSIDDIINALPHEFVLHQNYPNPFNPTTTISYQLPKQSNVELSIYNLLGQKVATLVSKKQPAGSHKVEWDATGFASGVYFYRLETDKDFVKTRKLVLLK